MSQTPRLELYWAYIKRKKVDIHCINLILLSDRENHLTLLLPIVGHVRFMEEVVEMLPDLDGTLWDLPSLWSWLYSRSSVGLHPWLYFLIFGTKQTYICC